MQDILEILKKVGTILSNDHFVGTSGQHFDTYLNKDALYPHTKETSLVARQFAEAHKGMNIDVVAAPALGGIILSTWTAHHLSELEGREILSVFVEKKDGDLKMTRGYDKIVSGKNILVIEDLTSTGGSLKQAIAAVQNAGGKVVGAAVMVNKNSEVTSETFGVPFVALSQFDVTIYEPEECEMCKSKVPVNTEFGHGEKFLQNK